MNGIRRTNIAQLLPYAMKSGLILGVLLCIPYIVQNNYKLSAGGILETKSLIYMIPSALWIVGIIVSTIQYRNKKNEGYITFGHAFFYCIYLCFFASLVLSAALLLLSTLHPQFIDTYSDEMRLYIDQTYENYFKGLPMASDYQTAFEQYKTALPHTMKDFISQTITQATIYYGIFFGLIIALIVKRNPK